MVKPLKDCKVLVTATTYGVNDPVLRMELEGSVGEVVYNTSGKPMSSEQLIRLLPGVDGYIAGLDAINRTALDAADYLKVIARYGVGVDAVDLQAAQEKGIVVTNTPGANSSSVAELTVGLMIALLRNIPASIQATKSGEWSRLRGLSLEGKTVGLVGFGAIGKQVARRLIGFGCRVIAFDPEAYSAEAVELGVELLPLADVVQRAEILSLHCPLTGQTRAMVNADFLAKMKAGSYLVNTARGELVDEEALYTALQAGKLSGAALDVFSKQPPEADNPLLRLPRVLATPHMAAHSDVATNTMGWMALNDCLAVLRGEEPRYRVI